MKEQGNRENPNFNDKGEYIGPESLELKLTRKVQQHDKDPNGIETITLVEPTIQQMAAFETEFNKSGNNWEAGAKLIGLVAKIPPSAVQKLSSRDFTEAMEFLTGFIDPGPKVGES